MVFNKPKRPITDQRAEDQTISYWSHKTNTKDRPESSPIFSSDSPPPFQTVTPPEYHPLPTPSRIPNFPYTAQSSTDQDWWNIGHFDRSTPPQPTIPRTIFQPQPSTVYTQLTLGIKLRDIKGLPMVKTIYTYGFHELFLKQIDEMFKYDIIEHSTSEYSSPIVLVKKGVLMEIYNGVCVLII